MRLLWLLAATMLSLADASCFRSVVSAVPRMVVDKPIANSDQACQDVCMQNSQCLGYTYGKTCSLLGNELDSKTCAVPSTIWIRTEGCTATTSSSIASAPTTTTSTTGKTTTSASTTTTTPTAKTAATGETTTSTSAPITTSTTLTTTTTLSVPDISAGMEGDPCGTLVPGLQIGKRPICPMGMNYVIRAKDEYGVTMTLENFQNKAIEWVETRGMWRYFDFSSISIHLTAASCATADDSPCSCQPLPKHKNREGGVPAVINQSPVCPTADMYMWCSYDTISWTKIRPIAMMLYTITCRAGIWLLETNMEGRQIVDASCFTETEEMAAG